MVCVCLWGTAQFLKPSNQMKYWQTHFLFLIDFHTELPFCHRNHQKTQLWKDKPSPKAGLCVLMLNKTASRWWGAQLISHMAVIPSDFYTVLPWVHFETLRHLVHTLGTRFLGDDRVTKWKRAEIPESLCEGEQTAEWEHPLQACKYMSGISFCCGWAIVRFWICWHNLA